MRMGTAIGRDNYVFFLKNVALLPFSPEQLLEMGKQEWARSVASQVYEEHRNAGIPQLGLFKNESEQIAQEQKDELAVRRYLQLKDILSVPDWLQHYRFAPTPAYLAGFADITELDDFTGPNRLKENCTRYISAPSLNLGYFAATMAKDPRGIIVHFPGRIPIQFDAIITIPAPTKVSVSTPKKCCCTQACSTTAPAPASLSGTSSGSVRFGLKWTSNSLWACSPSTRQRSI